jgi:hypothetical protein
MKGQTAVEFVIILAAVSALSVSIIAAYSTTSSSQNVVYNTILNSSIEGFNQTGQATYQSPYVYAYIPNVTYVNSSNRMEVLVYLVDNYSVNVSISGGGAVAVPVPDYGEDSEGFTTFPISVVPTMGGPFSLETEIRIVAENRTFLKNISLDSYAETGSTQETSPSSGDVYLEASLERHNESVIYNTTDWVPYYNATQSYHCSQENFFYQQYGIQTQCGSASWYYFYFSDYCYGVKGILTDTYCVYLNGTERSYSSLDPTPSYYYNLTLTLYNQSSGDGYTSNLSSGNPSGRIYSEGKAVGNVTVSNDIYGYGQLRYENPVLINESGAIRPEDSGSYTDYQNALSNFESMMNYYNGIEVSDSEYSAIQEAIGAFNTASEGLQTPQNFSVSGCYLKNSTEGYEYYCNPLQPLDYLNISTNFVGSTGIKNGSISLDGSIINIGVDK